LAEEDEDRVAAFVADNGYRIRPLALDGLADFITSEGFLRLTPHTAGTDGFFAAVLERPA
jgi:16S rRNA (cytosine967-C5)-methyltransferase